jgi:hypothetical protein
MANRRSAKSADVLTNADIASRIRRPWEDMTTTVDRIKNWTKDGALAFRGKKHPGTGSHRRYAPEAILDAAILMALTDAGLAAVRVGQFQGVDKQTVIGLGRMGAAAVFDPAHAPGRALAANEKVYLVIAGSPRASVHTTYLAYATPEKLPEIDLLKPTPLQSPASTKTAEHVLVPPDATWSVVLHLNKIFESLRGVITATLEHGVVKVRFIKGD